MKSPVPLISVVVPAYNVESYLTVCLDSIRDQSLTDIEIIVVNDGATDSTPELARDWVAAEDRAVLIEQPNAGLSAARNTGLAAARGEFVMFVDSDDTLPVDALDNLVGPLRDSRSDLSVGAYERTRGPANDTGLGVPAWIRKAHETALTGVDAGLHPEIIVNVIAMPKLYRRRFLLDNELLFVPGILYEDQDFAARVYTTARAIDVVPETVYHWRVREDRSSISQQISTASNSLALLEALDAAGAVYGASRFPWLRSRRIAHMLRVDLPPLAAAAANSDHETRAIARTRIRALLRGTTLAQWLATPIVPRVRVYCAWTANWSALLAFDELVRTEGLPLPVEARLPVAGSDSELARMDAAVPAAHFSAPELSALPSWIRSVGADDASFAANLQAIQWLDDDRIQLFGWAIIRGLSSRTDSSRLTAALVASSGDDRIELPVTHLVDTEVTEWARHRNARYDHNAFSVVIDITDQRMERPNVIWTVELTLSQDGVTRRGGLTHRHRGGTAGQLTGRWHDFGTNTGYVVPRYAAPEGLTLTFRRDAVVVDELRVSTDRRHALCRATVLRGNPTISAAVAINRRTGEEVPGKVRQTGGSFELRFTLPRRAQDDWELKVIDRSGARRLLTWRSGSGEGHRTSQLAHVEGYRWTRTPYGYAQLSAPPQVTFITDLELTEHAFVFTVEAAPGITELALGQSRLRTNARQIPPSRVATVAGGFELTFPTESTLFGFTSDPLPSGIYRLETPGGQDDRPRSAQLRTDDMARLRFDWNLPAFRAHTWWVPGSHDFRVTISPPLAADERGTRSQAELQSWYAEQSFEPENAVFFQCYRGETANDSQRVLHEELIRRGSALTVYWGVKDLSVAVPEGGVRVVIGSREWYRVVGSARFLCNNIEFDRFFAKRPYQFVLATFHGYPFKAMGKSMWENEGLTDFRINVELLRRQREWSGIVVPSSTAADQYREEYGYEGPAFVSGYPRNDPLVRQDRERVRTDTLARLGIDPARTVVLFAPTWRESLSTGSWSATLFDGLDLEQLSSELGDDYAILVRGHGMNAREDARASDPAVVDVTDYPEINDLIHAADVAILDYSSLRFDWALTGRPAVFYVPDKSQYFERRPALFDFDTSAPGPQIGNTAEVVSALRDMTALTELCSPQIAEFNRRFNELNDGKASERLIEMVGHEFTRVGAANAEAAGLL